MLLNVYQEAFHQAMRQRDAEEAIFQVHLMLQADPFDQQRIIVSALEEYLDQYPTTGEADEFADRMQAQFYSLDDQDAGREEWENLLGEMLHNVESLPSMLLQELIVNVAEKMEELGSLQRSTYPEQRSASRSSSSVRPDTSAQTRSKVKGRPPKSGKRSGLLGFLKRK